MPDYLRVYRKGACVFFTVVTGKRMRVLTTETTRAALRAAIQTTRQSLPFQINAWVLLPDHLHCVWTLPDNDSDFSARWSMIKRLTSQTMMKHPDGHPGAPPSASQQKRKESGFWQRRFWDHVIRDEKDYCRHIDYLHWNPVKHGLVGQVRQWPYSSFHRHVAGGLYPLDWGRGVDPEDEPDFGE